MKSVSVSDLKARLSHFLRQVQRGGELEVRDRGRPIARIVGLRHTPRDASEERLERLVAAGIVERGQGDLGWLLEDPPIEAPGADLRGAISADRDER